LIISLLFSLARIVVLFVTLFFVFDCPAKTQSHWPAAAAGLPQRLSQPLCREGFILVNHPKNFYKEKIKNWNFYRKEFDGPSFQGSLYIEK
jgi:hypothetical protein